MSAAMKISPTLRRFMLLPIVTVGLAVQIAVGSRSVSGATPFPTSTPATPTTLVVPVTVYTSITSCDVSFSKSDLSESDTFTVTANFDGPGIGFMRIGADDLGPERASVLVDSEFVSGLSTGSVADIQAALSMATGTHTMDFYAVTSDGLATGEPLCRVPYTLTGSTPYPVFTGPTELPRGAQGTLYSSNSVGNGGRGGAGVGEPFTYTPTAADPFTVQGCELVSASHDGGNGGNAGAGGNGGSAGPGGNGGNAGNGGAGGVGGNGGNGGVGGYGGVGGNGGNGGVGGYGGVVGNGGNGGVGGVGGVGGNGGNGGLLAGGVNLGGVQLVPSPDGLSTELLDTGMNFFPADVTGRIGPTSCGRLSGTPTKAGTYWFTVRMLYQLAPVTAPGAVPAALSDGVDEQTFATYQTFTHVIEVTPTIEATPSFTG